MAARRTWRAPPAAPAPLLVLLAAAALCAWLPGGAMGQATTILGTACPTFTIDRTAALGFPGGALSTSTTFRLTTNGTYAFSSAYTFSAPNIVVCVVAAPGVTSATLSVSSEQNFFDLNNNGVTVALRDKRHHQTTTTSQGDQS
jgi:lipopolysaccharide export system protein LptC